MIEHYMSVKTTNPVSDSDIAEIVEACSQFWVGRCGAENRLLLFIVETTRLGQAPV
jgi:hypothetical protein